MSWLSGGRLPRNRGWDCRQFTRRDGVGLNRALGSRGLVAGCSSRLSRHHSPAAAATGVGWARATLDAGSALYGRGSALTGLFRGGVVRGAASARAATRVVGAAASNERRLATQGAGHLVAVLSGLCIHALEVGKVGISHGSGRDWTRWMEGGAGPPIRSLT